MAKEKRIPYGIIWTIVSIIILAIVAVVIFVPFDKIGGSNTSGNGTSGGNTGSNEGTITYRNATASDIDGHWDSGILDNTYVFIPKHNITNLQFTFSIRNNKNEEIKTITKNIGNVTKGQQYTVTLTATDLGDLSTMWNAKTTYLTVSGGRVALF